MQRQTELRAMMALAAPLSSCWAWYRSTSSRVTDRTGRSVPNHRPKRCSSRNRRGLNSRARLATPGRLAQTVRSTREGASSPALIHRSPRAG